MKFLLDQDVYAVTGSFLSELGHDVVRVAEIGMAAVSDEDLLITAHEQNRIMLTCDRDYGSLVFVKDYGAGVIYLRIRPSTQNSVHAELKRILDHYGEEELTRAFVVVEPDGHRVRHLHAADDEAVQ
jgi:predicted nuclease of predicted toxin-antitoxin system